MVRLRFKRFGRRNRPFYRLNAIDQRTARDGKVIEHLGSYDPRAEDDQKTADWKMDRIEHWLSVGARPSETVASLLKKAGVDPAAAAKKD